MYVIIFIIYNYNFSDVSWLTMCDRIDENQDPIHKLSRQLSELASTQQDSHFITDTAEGNQWTPFSGIPSSQSGTTPLSTLYPWSTNTDNGGEIHNSPVFDDNSQGNIHHQTLNNYGTDAHFLWQSDSLLNPGETFYHPPVEIGPGYEQHSTFGAYGNHFQESENLPTPFGDFLFKRDNFSNPGGACSYNRFDDSPSALNLSPNTRVSYNPFCSSSNHNHSADNLEENFQSYLSGNSGFGAPVSPSFDSSSIHSFPTESAPSEKRSLSREASHDPENNESERKAPTNLDYSFEKHSSLPEVDTTPVTAGRQIYAESLKSWHSFDSSNVHPVVGEALNKPSLPDLSKPSYSDIAKTPRSNQPPVSKQDLPLLGKNQKTRKDSKGPPPFVRRTSSGSKFWPRGHLDGNEDLPKMSTNSRYGLDSFGDTFGHSKNTCTEIHSGGSINRKKSESFDNSTSGMSGQGVNSRGDASSQSTNAKSEQSPTLNAVFSSHKQIKKGNDNLFFDPRRIFQTSTSRSKSSLSQGSPLTALSKSSGDETSTEHTVLNNGKPLASTNSSKLPTTARRHDYINNDLRDSSKLTNQTAADAEVLYPANNCHDNRRKESRTGSGRRTSGKVKFIVFLFLFALKKKKESVIIIFREFSKFRDFHQYCLFLLYLPPYP